MARFKKASADEARARRNDHVRKGAGAAAGGEVMVKGWRSAPSWNPEKRSARYTMSSEGVDRYGDIVVQSGLAIDRFLENPQGLLFHNSRSWPCGNWSDITKILNGRPKRTEGTLNFLPEGVDDDADRAVRHVAVNSIRTVSIGFAPDWDNVDLILDDDEEWVTGLRFNQSELLECSLVPIPAQPDALVKDVGGDLVLARDIIEDILDNYAKTPEGLLLPLDEFRARHLDIVGERSFHVVKALTREPKIISREDRKLAATTDEEAAEYVGASVQWDPAHAENKEAPASTFFADCTGEIIASYIVDSGEFKGVHALAVEWTNKEGRAVGMYRGLRADRVLLAAKTTAEAETEGEEEPQVDLEGEVAAFAAFLEQAKSGDEIWVRVAATGDVVDGVKVMKDNGFELSRDGKSVAIFEVAGELTDDHKEAVDARLKELALEPPVPPVLTDEVVDAFVGLTAIGDVIKLAAGDIFRITINRGGEEIEELLLLDTMTFGDAMALRDKIAARVGSGVIPAEDEPTIGTIELELDTTEATQRLTALEKLIDVVGTKWAKLFGRDVPSDRVEPTIEAAAPPAGPPTDDEMKAVFERAGATQARLVEKGLVEA